MIHADLTAVLAIAERLGVPEDRIAAIRNGDRRTLLALLGAIAHADGHRTVIWSGVGFTAANIAAVKAPSHRLWNLLHFLSRAGFRQIVHYNAPTADHAAPSSTDHE